MLTKQFIIYKTVASTSIQTY